MKKICIVTGTRAEYGLLYPVMKQVQSEPTMQLQIIATGAHLSPEFGLTYRNIELDGFTIDAKVEMLLSSDTAVGVAKSIGLGVIGFADVLQKMKPDLLLVLGDRYEIFAVVQAALVARIPVAHIAGGDITEGAYDEAIRHSITKMAHIHFATNEQAAARIRQMGENPDNVFNVGSPGIDQIKNLQLLSRQKLEKALDFKFRERNFLVTFHPVTLDDTTSTIQFDELLGALDSWGDSTGIIFTKPNADNEGRAIGSMIDEYVATRDHARVFISLGQLNYLSMVAAADVVIGNSSSGFYEVPSLKKPTVNIGSRQKGRIAADSVVNCVPEKQAIIEAIKKALSLDCSQVINPYGDGGTTQRIIAILKGISCPKSLLVKRFYEA